MSREIKFKALVKDNLGNEKTIIDYCWLGTNKRFNAFIFGNNEFEVLDVFEFTGFKDIYEKDKVRLTFFDEYSNDCVTVESDAIIEGVVKMDEGSWIVKFFL